jgi:uncharacterized phage protein (TIGR02216 family)
MSVLPWSQLIVAASQIGLTPHLFWKLSVREWRALIGEGQALDRVALSDLIKAFPDDLE